MVGEDEARREIGERVDYWMRRRGMTRQIFADRVGKSVSWVDKVRRGDRQLDRLTMLEQIADVLGVSIAVLLESDEQDRRSCADEYELARLSQALTRYDGLLGQATSATPDLVRLRRQVNYGWLAFQSANYMTSTQLLPELLAELQHAYRTAEGADREVVAELLTQAYWLASSIAMKYGRADLGWVAADRGMMVAEWTGDVSLIAGTARRVVHAVMESADEAATDHAIAIVRTVADRFEPVLGEASLVTLSAYGMLVLKGSIAAGRAGNAQLARDFHVEAAAIAQRLGGDRNDHWSAFGPVNVAVHRVSALADLHEGGRAVEFAQSLDEGRLRVLPRERRAAHLIDIARGYEQWGKRDEAVKTVLEADDLAREEVRCRPLTRTLVSGLARSHARGQRPNEAFAGLARHMGVAI